MAETTEKQDEEQTEKQTDPTAAGGEVVKSAPEAANPEAADAEAADAEAGDFARQAEEAPLGLVAEFADFLIHNKKWWLTPIILVLLLLGLLAFINTTPYAPFIYQGF